MGWGSKAGDRGIRYAGQGGILGVFWTCLGAPGAACDAHTCDVCTKQDGVHLQPYIPCRDPTITKQQDGSPARIYWVRRSPSCRAVGPLSPSPTQVTGEAWRLSEEGELGSHETGFATKVEICIALRDTRDAGSCNGVSTGPPLSWHHPQAGVWSWCRGTNSIPRV